MRKSIAFARAIARLSAERGQPSNGVPSGFAMSQVTPPTFAYPEGARYAPLPMIIKAKSKPIKEAPLASLGVDAGLKVKYDSFALPPARKAGKKVKNVAELVSLLRSEAKVL